MAHSFFINFPWFYDLLLMTNYKWQLNKFKTWGFFVCFSSHHHLCCFSSASTNISVKQFKEKTGSIIICLDYKRLVILQSLRSPNLSQGRCVHIYYCMLRHRFGRWFVCLRPRYARKIHSFLKIDFLCTCLLIKVMDSQDFRLYHKMF